jgi:DNA polymerase V
VTFFVCAQGESMLGAGIHPNDILIVDRSIELMLGKISSFVC